MLAGPSAWGRGADAEASQGARLSAVAGRLSAVRRRGELTQTLLGAVRGNAEWLQATLGYPLAGAAGGRRGQVGDVRASDAAYRRQAARSLGRGRLCRSTWSPARALHDRDHRGQARDAEVLARLPARQTLWVLDERGEQATARAGSAARAGTGSGGAGLTLCIGGADGHSDAAGRAPTICGRCRG